MVKFSSKIFKLGINPVVDPPDRIMRALFDQAGRSRGPIPVRGRLNGAEFVQTLVKYQGVWRLYINGPMLKASGLSVGELAKIEIEFDLRPRDVPMPEALSIAFRKDKRAKAAFEKLSPSRQKEISRYIGSLKTAESVKRSVDRVIAQLRNNL